MKLTKKTRNIGLIVIGIIVLFIIVKMMKAKADNTRTEKQIASSSASSTNNTNPTTGSSTTVSENDRVLKLGSKGDRVEWVQYYFNKYVASKKNMTKLVQDGVFGKKTEAAVRTVMGKNTTTWTEFKARVDYNFKN